MGALIEDAAPSTKTVKEKIRGIVFDVLLIVALVALLLLMDQIIDPIHNTF